MKIWHWFSGRLADSYRQLGPAKFWATLLITWGVGGAFAAWFLLWRAGP